MHQWNKRVKCVGGLELGDRGMIKGGKMERGEEEEGVQQGDELKSSYGNKRI